MKEEGTKLANADNTLDNPNWKFKIPFVELILLKYEWILLYSKVFPTAVFGATTCASAINLRPDNT